jgi:hypothetical protein
VKRKLLVIAKEDLDGQPRVATDLEALGQRVNHLDLLVSQLPAVELEVGLDARGRDRLGDDARPALQTPHKQDLLDSLPFLLGELLELLVLVERRVGGAETGVGSGVDTLLLEVVEQLRPRYSSQSYTILEKARYLRRVVGVKFNLVDRRRGLESRVGEELLEVLDGEVRNTNVLHATGLGELLQLGPGVTEVPVRVVLAEIFGVGG